MTDNTVFKKEAAELLDKVISFRLKYLAAKVREPMQTAPSVLFESQLRMMLMVARTDEENAHQKKIDSYL